uniref:Col_cuticle_N domain-containing protein n=1 Tax=Parastrongyloides trichosuri TaxID=131310 RepID=A0A0N4Z703_PARTI
MNETIKAIINTTTKSLQTTTEYLNKGYWDTIEGQAIRTAKRWARDVFISFTSIIILVTIIISVSCIRAYIKSKNDALIHDPEERWIKSMCLDYKMQIMDSKMYEEESRLLIVKLDDKDDVENFLKVIQTNDNKHQNGIVGENIDN